MIFRSLMANSLKRDWPALKNNEKPKEREKKTEIWVKQHRTYWFHQNYCDQRNTNLDDPAGHKLNVDQEYGLVVMKVKPMLRYEDCPRKLGLLRLGQQRLLVGCNCYLLLPKPTKTHTPFRWQGKFQQGNSDRIFRNVFTPGGASAPERACGEALGSPSPACMAAPWVTCGFNGEIWPALSRRLDWVTWRGH